MSAPHRPPLRAWVGGIVQETNAFSPIPTAFEDFGGARPRWPGYGEFIEGARDVKQAIFVREPNTPIGRSALLRIDGGAGPVHVVIADQRHQVFTPHVFTGHGLDPARGRLVVVKSTQHFHAGFAPLASAIVRCDAGGTVTSDPTLLPYRHRSSPCWPWEHDAACTPMALGETA